MRKIGGVDPLTLLLLILVVLCAGLLALEGFKGLKHPAPQPAASASAPAPAPAEEPVPTTPALQPPPPGGASGII